MALRLIAVARSLGGVNHSTATLLVPFSKALGLLCRLQGVVERQRPVHRFIMMMKPTKMERARMRRSAVAKA